MVDERDAVAVDDEFARLVAVVEPPLRRAFVAAYGPADGREALVDVLAWAWEHFDRLRDVENTAGYLWRVGQTWGRRRRRRTAFEVPVAAPGQTLTTTLASSSSREHDDALVAALAALTLHQRVAVVLVHGYDYSLAEAAAVLGCSVSTVRNHVARGLERARHHLEKSER